MKQKVPMRESVSITLSGAGGGTAKVGPLSAREKWYPQNVSIGVSSNTNEATCNVYKGPAATANNFRDTSIQASSGDATGACSGDVLDTGDYIWAVWTGGDAGAQATLTVTGFKEV